MDGDCRAPRNPHGRATCRARGETGIRPLRKYRPRPWQSEHCSEGAGRAAAFCRRLSSLPTLRRSAIGRGWEQRRWVSRQRRARRQEHGASLEHSDSHRRHNSGSRRERAAHAYERAPLPHAERLEMCLPKHSLRRAPVLVAPILPLLLTHHQNLNEQHADEAPKRSPPWCWTAESCCCRDHRRVRRTDLTGRYA